MVSSALQAGFNKCCLSHELDVWAKQIGLKWPQFLHLGKRVAPSCLTGLPRGGHWDLVNPTVSGNWVPGFPVEEAGSAWGAGLGRNSISRLLYPSTPDGPAAQPPSLPSLTPARGCR